jgi:hypothetical protein
LADERGKIRRVVSGFRSFRDVAAISEIVEGQVRVDLTALVEQLVEVAIDEQPPVQATAGPGVLRMAADRSRAVLRERVVPLRMVGESIDFIEVVNQQRPRLRGGNADAIQVNLLAAVVGSQPDQVAFIRDYVIQLVLSEEATKRRV